MNKDRASKQEISELVEAMATIQTLPQMERVALQFYIKGILAAMTGQLPIISGDPPPHMRGRYKGAKLCL